MWSAVVLIRALAPAGSMVMLRGPSWCRLRKRAVSYSSDGALKSGYESGTLG